MCTIEHSYRGISLERLTRMLALGPVVLYLATHTIKVCLFKLYQKIITRDLYLLFRGLRGGCVILLLRRSVCKGSCFPVSRDLCTSVVNGMRHCWMLVSLLIPMVVCLPHR